MRNIDSGLFMEFLGGAGSQSLPFLSDDNTYFWDFSASTRTLNGGDVSYVPEMTRGVANYEQSTASLQPTATADGISFANGAGEEMELDNPVPLNAAQGIYTAFLIKFDASYAGGAFHKVYASDNPNKVGRLVLDPINFGGYQAYSYIDQADGNSFTNRIRPSASTTRGSWLVLEWLHDFDNDLIKYWVDGTEDGSATLFTSFASSAYPASNSLGARIGNAMFGEIKAQATYDGVPPDSIRQSVSDYLVSIKP